MPDQDNPNQPDQSQPPAGPSPQGESELPDKQGQSQPLSPPKPPTPPQPASPPKPPASLQPPAPPPPPPEKELSPPLPPIAKPEPPKPPSMSIPPSPQKPDQESKSPSLPAMESKPEPPKAPPLPPLPPIGAKPGEHPGGDKPSQPPGMGGGTPPPIPVAGKTVVSKKGGGGGFKKFLLIFFLLALLVGGGAVGVWWWLNRPTETGAVTLNYWGLWEPESVMKPLLDQYMQAHPNVTINYVNSAPEEYRQRLSNQLAAETPEVDIFRFHNTWVPMLRGYLSPVPQSVFTTDEFNNTFYPEAQKDLKVGTNYVGIPLMVDGLGLFYNEDLFIAAGETPPTDWVEFRRIAKELTVKDDAGNIKVAGAAMGSVTNVDHWPDIVGVLMYQGSANPASPNTPAGREALTFYSLFTKVDKVWDETLPNSTLAFATGKLAMYFGPSWRISNLNDLAKKNGVKLRFKVAPIPQLPETNITWASYWVEGVSNKSTPQQQAAAWDLLAYLSQKDTLEQLYQLQTQEVGGGFAYSRVDLSDQLKSHPQLGAFVLQAPAARSWYLASDTTDKGGLDARIISYYQDAANLAVTKGVSNSVMDNLQKGVSKVLGEYGVQ